MARRVPVLVLCVALVPLWAGCLSTAGGKFPKPVAEALAAPDELVLYSLEPGKFGDKDGAPNTFHGHTILGRTEVTDAKTQKRLVDALKRGVSDHDGSVAACFIPHHGLRVRKGDQVIDLVVCFKCAQVNVYENGTRGEGVLISTSPRATFNEVLKQAKVPLSKDAE